ncbi:MAG: hypothetical protein H0X01_01115 [Nitrospira sp.]|nr:hypothetical protein [Nitrospira sp.]
MTIPQPIMRKLSDRLGAFDPPPFGKVKIELELNYTEGQLHRTHLAAYPVETVKA